MYGWAKKITIFLWYIFASFIILAAVIGVMLQVLTPVINHHKAYIEKYASNLLHVDVHITSVQADWARFGPEVHFKGLSLNETITKKTIFQADDISVQLGILGTLWHRTLYFSALKVSGSHILIRETAPNHYWVNDAFSIDLSDQSPSRAPEFFAWLITQNTVRLSKLQVDLFQFNGSTVSIQLDQANVYQSNQVEERKKLSVSIEGNLLARMSEKGDTFKNLQSQLMLYAWIDLYKQKLELIELEILGQDIVLQKNNFMHVYPHLEGVFLWQPVENNWILQGKKISLTHASQQSDHYSFEVWRFPDQYAAHLNSLNLADVSTIADFLSVTPNTFDFKQANFQGRIEDIDLVIPHDFSAIDQYRFSAVLHHVSSAAYQELPEMHHLSGAISGKLAQGDFILLDKKDEIFFPHYFNQSIPVNKLTARGQWHHTPNEFSLLLNSIHVTTPVVAAQGMMELNLPLHSSASPMLALLAQYHLTQSQAVTTLLPMKEFDPDFEKWLTDAIGPGLGSDGKVLIQGSVNDFPYANQQGVFIVDGSVKPSTITFSPEWPSIENVTGRLLLHNQQFDAFVSGSGLGVTIQHAHVAVPDYEADHSWVNVDLTATANVADYLHYLHQSPLRIISNEWLSPFEIQGRGALSLHLGLPLDQLDVEHIQVSGRWLAQDASFKWKPLDAKMNNIYGAIHFTQNGIDADHIHATVGNEPLQINISTEQTKNTMSAIHVDAEGDFSVAQLEEIFKMDSLSSYVSGRSRYHAHLRLPMTTSEYLISVETNLQGITLHLPEPLGKKRDAPVPLFLQASINPATDLLHLLIRYAEKIDAKIDIQHLMQTQVNQQTIQADIHALALSWPMNIVLPQSSSKTTTPWWRSLSLLKLHFDRLSVYDHHFSHVALSAVKNKEGYSCAIQADETKGNIDLPFDSKLPITVNLKYLTLASQNKTTMSNSNVTAKNAANWPEILLNIQSLKLGKQNIGEVKLHTTPLTNGMAFNNIHIQNNLYRFIAHGQWINLNNQDSTVLQGSFYTKNVGEFLKENEITQNFQAKAGSVGYNILWPGSPMNFQLKSIEGDATLQVKDGVIPVSGDAAKMGLGKVLSLFSAQSIQRRLQLNFSDLSQNGYSFNSLISQLHFQSGNANVKEGVFDGPEARIAFSGRLGLIKQDYNVKLVVTPYVTSTLPLIATLAGGPIAGVATYAFDKIAEGSIAKLTSYHYWLIGPWDQPKLIDLDAQAKQREAARQAQLDAKNVAPVEEAAG